jgi:Domain of unknown function (DUF4160)
MDQEPKDEDIRRFVLEVTRQRVAYLKYTKSRGYPVDEEQIARFEEEIRVEEVALGESQEDLIGQQSIAELQSQLAFVDVNAEGSPQNIKVLLLRRLHTKVRMRREQNHRRPHFHMEYKQQYSASYAVDTLERIAGDMPRKYEGPILEWAAKHQRSLTATWESLNAGEDVREMTVVAEEDA